MVYIVICILFFTTYSRVYSLEIACNSTKSCSECLSEKGCAFRVCKVDDKFTNTNDCKLIESEKQCANGGNWSDVTTKNTTTEVHNSPIGIDNNNLTSTTTTTTNNTNTTIRSSCANNTTTTTQPTTDTNNDLLHKTSDIGVPFWPIIAIVISFLIAVVAISFLATRRIRKKYFDQSHYQPLLEDVQQSIFPDVIF